MSLPDFSYEKKLWRKGYQLVIGIDEVGRGAFAGPVVAGAAAVKISNIKYQISKTQIKYQKEKNKRIRNTKYIILNTISSLGINDSKKLSPQKREKLEKDIKKYFYWGIGKGSVVEINRIGIVKATEKAMRRAVTSVILSFAKRDEESPTKSRSWRGSFAFAQDDNKGIFVLIDAFYIKYIPGVGLKNQLAIIKGDQKSISIAAASILAKVYRDNLMRRLSRNFKRYHWEDNKGYGTEKHREAIRKFGATIMHRREFVKKWV